MDKLHFNLRDLFFAPQIAFGLQKTWIAFLGFIGGYTLYALLMYVSILLSGLPIDDAWSHFGIFPCAFTSSLPWFSTCIAILAVFIFFISFMFTQTAISRAVYMHVKNVTYHTWQDSFQFAWKKLMHAVLTPLSIFLLVSLMLVAFYLIGLLGNIPFLGSIGISLFLIVWFIGTIFMIFFFIVAIFSTILAPSILATTEDDVFEAVFQSFSTITSRPFEFSLSLSIGIILSLSSAGLVALLFFASVSVMNTLFINWSGEEFQYIVTNGLALAEQWTKPLYTHVEKFMQHTSTELSISGNISAHLYTLFLLIISGWTVAYFIASFSTSMTLSFIGLKYKKDNDNLVFNRDIHIKNDDYLEKNE